MKTIDDLLNSDYAFLFEIERVRTGVISMHKPQFISFSENEIEVQFESDLFISIISRRFNLTLYKNSVTTHLVIF